MTDTKPEDLLVVWLMGLPPEADYAKEARTLMDRMHTQKHLSELERGLVALLQQVETDPSAFLQSAKRKRRSRHNSKTAP